MDASGCVLRGYLLEQGTRRKIVALLRAPEGILRLEQEGSGTREGSWHMYDAIATRSGRPKHAYSRIEVRWPPPPPPLR